MTTKCDPCDCPEQYYRDSQSWRKAMITILCDIERAIDLIVGIQGDGVNPCAEITTTADGTLYVCKDGVMHPLAGNTGDVLVCTDGATDKVAFQVSAAGAFTWDTTEQVWPFEKAVGGGTVYAKEIAFGALPNTTAKSVAHNIVGLTSAKVFRMESITAGTVGGGADSAYPITYGNAATNFIISLVITDTDVVITTWDNWSNTSAFVRVYYTK